MKVSAVLDQKGRTVHTIGPGALISEAASMLVARGVGALLVVGDKKQAVGMLSERDIVAGMAASGADLRDTKVEALMTTNLIKCAPNDSMVRVMATMTDRRIRHLPVYDGDELQGIVSIGDAVKNRIGEIEAEAKALREYIAM